MKVNVVIGNRTSAKGQRSHLQVSIDYMPRLPAMLTAQGSYKVQVIGPFFRQERNPQVET